MTVSDPTVIEGDAAGCVFYPGRDDGYLSMELMGVAPGSYDRATALTAESGSDVTADGVPVTWPQLMSYLAAHRCRVRAWPIPERYDACLKAEFTTRKE